MINAIKTYLREIAANGGRGGTNDSRSRKGFGSAEVRAKAAATRSANRKRDVSEALRQAVIRAQKGRCK